MTAGEDHFGFVGAIEGYCCYEKQNFEEENKYMIEKLIFLYYICKKILSRNDLMKLFKNTF